MTVTFSAPRGPFCCFWLNAHLSELQLRLRHGSGNRGLRGPQPPARVGAQSGLGRPTLPRLVSRQHSSSPSRGGRPAGRGLPRQVRPTACPGYKLRNCERVRFGVNSDTLADLKNSTMHLRPSVWRTSCAGSPARDCLLLWRKLNMWEGITTACVTREIWLT